MKIAQSSLLFATGTFLSRISGLIRDQVVLGVFGASILLDAFFLAFRIPNLFREMLAEGALGSSFTKIYSELKTKDPRKAETLLGDSLILGTYLLGFLTVFGVFAAPVFVDVMTSFSEIHQIEVLRRHATGLTKLIFPFLGIAILGAVASGALYQKGRFFTSSIAPMSFNVFYILGAVVFSQGAVWFLPDTFDETFCDRRLFGLGLGVLIGGVSQFLLQLKVVWGELKVYQIKSWIPWTPESKRVVVLMGPAALAASAGPINLVINTNFAAAVGEGAISWLVVAFRLVQLPVGIFGVAVGVAILPNLSRAMAASSNMVTENVKAQFVEGLTLVMFLLAPCVAFLMGSNYDVVRLLFQHGAFTGQDALNTGDALQAYSFSIFAYGALKVLMAMYYALERTSYALYAAFVCVAVNFFGNYFLVERLGHVGLAVTSAATLTVNALLLFWGLRRYQMSESFWFVGKLFLFLVAFVTASWIVQSFCSDWLGGIVSVSSLGVKAGSLVHVLANGFLVLIVYVGFVWGYFRKPPWRLKKEFFTHK